ncbi:MAG: DUF1134 domain-containing protein [Magnetospirillum sp. WYHS-4]
MKGGVIVATLVLVAGLAQAGAARAADEGGFSPEEIVAAAGSVFGAVSEGLADVVQKAFADHGRPTAYIAGEEVSGAFAVGLRYGKGKLARKTAGERPIYWQGPSVGFDFGGNASKTFVLVYNLKTDEDIFQRFPAGEGGFYFVAGVGITYQQSGEVIVAPIRTGVGLRAGANVGYVHYTRDHSWLPF